MKKICYELWINGKIIAFPTAKEAYLHYLDKYATKDDFDYYKECSGKSLKDNVNDEKLIQMMFDNVFNEKHHIYKVYEREDGQICRDKLN